ncbi:MAG: glycosyltransferase family 4 protein [Clostridia bacterium]
MFENKKVLVVATSDDMIYHFFIKHLEKILKCCNQVDIACNQTGFWFEELANNGFNMKRVDFPRKPLSLKICTAYKQLKKLVLTNEYDLIICQQPVGGAISRLVASKCKIPVVYIAHGFHFYKGCPLKNKLIFKTIEKWLSKYTDALVTMNEEDYQAAKTFKAKKVFKIDGIGFDDSKQKVVLTKEEILKKEFGIKEDDFVLVSIGELNQNKNHKVVLDALKLIDTTNIKYIICGQGSKEEEYTKFIKLNNLEGVVILAGYRKDVQDVLKLADVFVMPSFREGLPMSMMEAMNLGLPVITTNIRGCSDLIQNEEGGLLLEPKNVEGFAGAILYLQDDKNICKNMTEINLKNIEKYRIQNVLLEMEQVYDSITFGGAKE